MLDYILWIREQRIKVEFACIVELISGCLCKETVHYRKFLHLFPCIKDSLMGRDEAVVKTLHNCHRKNNQPILMRLERTTKHICYVPDHRCLFCYIRTDYGKFIIRH